jgi:hypothetical protein
MSLQPFVWPWPVLQFRNFCYTVGRTAWMGISPSQGLCLHTGQHKHRTNAYTDTTLSWIRTHDRSVRPSEDSSCLRPRIPCGLHVSLYSRIIIIKPDIILDFHQICDLFPPPHFSLIRPPVVPVVSQPVRSTFILLFLLLPLRA